MSSLVTNIAERFDLRYGLSLITARQRCVRPRCPRCQAGLGHGPYRRLAGIGHDGRLHRLTVGIMDGPLAQAVVTLVRTTRMAARKPPEPRGARPGQPPVYHDGALLEYLGMRRAKGRLIEVRSFPAERRWQNEYVLLDGAYRALFTEAAYVALRREATVQRHRACRLRQPFDEAAFWQVAIAQSVEARQAGPPPDSSGAHGP